ncbi:uncharacterized protein LOC129590536 [Paramacrobiotus metropolitanus]|uniref:uncharacterized protein LOC129590536 n=1 Tax=Paramacrobiotus metropolitanus TaxID=2943436 RepID=UPI0024464014|nr:uncharacterized protein LOC129590536 [Paramacrobiotus metropolitanus]
MTTLIKSLLKQNKSLTAHWEWIDADLQVQHTCSQAVKHPLRHILRELLPIPPELWLFPQVRQRPVLTHRMPPPPSARPPLDIPAMSRRRPRHPPLFSLSPIPPCPFPHNDAHRPAVYRNRCPRPLLPSIATMEYLTPRSSLSRTPTGTVSQEPSRVRSPWSDPPTRAVTPSTALAGGDRVTPGLRTGSLEGGNHGDQALRPQMPGAVFPGDQMLGEHAKGFAGQACACSPCTVQCVCPCPCPVPCPPMPELPPRIVESTETWRRYSKGPPSLFAWGVFVGICAVLLFLYLGSSLPACVRQYIPFIRQNLYAENYSYRRRPYDAFWTSCGTSFLEWWMYTRNLFFNY